MKRYRGYTRRIAQPRQNGVPFWVLLLLVTLACFIAVIFWPAA